MKSDEQGRRAREALPGIVLFLCCLTLSALLAGWHAAPLPDAYRQVLDDNFPHRVHFAGNLQPALGIEVRAKKPFVMTDGTPAK